MTEKPYLDLRDIEGVQHCHGPDCDEYYFRAVVYGKDLFTYVAHIPPHGGVSGDQHESDLWEMSLYVIDGFVTVTKGQGTPNDVEEKYVLRPHVGMHFPRGKPYGMWNETDEPASLVLTFSPAPGHVNSPEEQREFVASRGRSVFPAAEMNAMAGPLLED